MLLSSVTVWVAVSLFVHVTVWPGATVSDCGAKAKLAIVTLFAPAGTKAGAAADEADGAVVAGIGVFVTVPPPQAARITVAALLATPERNVRRASDLRR
ncbi:MAG: hypothetical protein ACR2M3_07020 [Thermomicrobiales bacterium]